MNKSELIKVLADELNIHPSEAKDIVSVFFDSIKEAMLKGERIEIRGFGSFQMKHYEGYEGRNPRTGEKVQVAPKRLPFFRPGKDLKEHVNS
ncbi:HU family DNA-binding protein [Desulfonatronovibrio magnus]|uniref:HU family DNA-binding protein n=1 Tax=Desulfonatronovibrio magnus TaxID=698827 RepID=UPI0005EB7D62|nr:HU family DNA-binding protein [Desulfonatronovibrio magnus]RQD59719.1 MAG: integration host factor subunit beta [Desulfonatronovibrio sp. MSAO_Bac4]